MRRSWFLLVPVLLLGGILLSAQTKNLQSLQDAIRQAEDEIRATNVLLSKTQSDQKATQSQLKLIRTKIKNRRNIISNLEKQTALINDDIAQKSDTVSRMEQQLTQLRQEYGQMIYESYKNYKLNNFTLFLFASSDFNDATRRISYMKRYNTIRREKALEIDSITRTVTQQVGELQSKGLELQQVYDSRSAELVSLNSDETQYKKVSNELSSKAGKLSSTIKAKQDQINKLQQQIQKMIAEESKKNKNTSRTAAQEEYLQELSGKFDQNRGKLPYPVRGGVIVDNYGVHAHPDQKGLMVNNKGVNIAAGSGAQITSVFEGEVSRVFFFQGLNNSVIIRHGDYLTVYSNLKTVSVKTGDKVKTNQAIGNLSADGGEEDNVLHFEIWQETSNLNPEEWLRR